MVGLQTIIARAWIVAVLLAPGAALGTVSIAPSPSYDGTYTVSWTDGSGGMTRAYLAESLNGGAWTKTTVTGTTSKAFTGRAVGDYAYKVQIYLYDGELRREIFEYETAPATVSVWKSVPAMPGATAGPASDDDGAYTLSWTKPPGVVTRYEVLENSFRISPDPTTTSVTRAARAAGNWTYQVRACNALGCGPYNSVFSVLVISNLGTGVPNAPAGPTEQALAAPMAQGWAGRVPGSATVDGGAAGYQIDVQLPPGRGGMQPAVALRYGSREGNGVAGVGWSLSGGGSIYRCPKTYALDGASAPVRLDGEDRLCLDGQRLMRVGGSAHGLSGSEYRTEIESFARVTLLGGDISTTMSSFKVERRSGVTAIYKARLPILGAPLVPDTWDLAAEFDPRGNCIGYTTTMLDSLGVAAQWGLTSIGYGGRWYAAGSSCTLDAAARWVTFTYEDRPEWRRSRGCAGARPRGPRSPGRLPGRGANRNGLSASLPARGFDDRCPAVRGDRLQVSRLPWAGHGIDNQDAQARRGRPLRGDRPRALRGVAPASVLHEPAGQLDAVAHAQLVEDGLEVALHGLRGDAEPLGHLAGAQPVGHQQRHLALPAGQAVGGRRLDQLAGRRGRRLGGRLAPQVELRPALADRRHLDAEPLAVPLHDEGAAHARRAHLGALGEPLQLGRQDLAVGDLREEDLEHLLGLAVAPELTAELRVSSGAPRGGDADVRTHHD